MSAMKKELLTHAIFWLIYFAIIVIVKQYFDITFIPLLIGGLIGIVLPDIDHLIYVYFIKPGDLSSQRVNYLLDKKEIIRSVELLYETREERKELIFHTLYFQAIFFVLMFWVLSSSGSVLGRSLVVSFMMHLSIDQFLDLKNMGNLDNWFKYLPFKLDYNQSKFGWIATTSLVLLVGMMI